MKASEENRRYIGANNNYPQFLSQKAIIPFFWEILTYGVKFECMPYVQIGQLELHAFISSAPYLDPDCLFRPRLESSGWCVCVSVRARNKTFSVRCDEYKQPLSNL